MTKSKLHDWGIAEWSIRVTDHVTRSDRHNWHYCTWGDKRRRYQTRGDKKRQEFAMIWLDRIESQYVIKGAVVRLNWGLNSVIAE